MSAVLFDRDPDTGAVESFHYDESADSVTIGRQSMDLAPTLDRNKTWANHVEQRGDMRLAASIPVDVTYEWLQKYGIRAWDRNHWPAVKRLLNSNEYRYLRTSDIII
jgi:hypothetical protein